MALLLERLEPKEREIIRLRFGFNDNRFFSLKEAGERLNILPSKVKDLESIALFKLKKILAESDRDD
jgi:DNA-directed RNA polymerase sigma subunit (sigma70/sigma32)